MKKQLGNKDTQGCVICSKEFRFSNQTDLGFSPYTALDGCMTLGNTYLTILLESQFLTIEKGM